MFANSLPMLMYFECTFIPSKERRITLSEYTDPLTGSMKQMRLSKNAVLGKVWETLLMLNHYSQSLFVKF